MPEDGDHSRSETARNEPDEALRFRLVNGVFVVVLPPDSPVVTSAMVKEQEAEADLRDFT